MTKTPTEKITVNHALDAEATAASATLAAHLLELEETRKKQTDERDAILLRIAKAKQTYNSRELEKAEHDLAWFGHSDNPRAESNFRDAQKTKHLRHELDQAIELFRGRLQHLAITLADKRAEQAIQFLLPSVGHDRQAAASLADSLPHVAASRELVSAIATIALEGVPLLESLQRVHKQIAGDLAKLS